MLGQRLWQPYPAELPGGAAAGGGGGGGTQVFLKSDSGFADGPSAGIPAAPTRLSLVSEAATVTVTAGQYIIIHTSVEYDAADAGSGTITQFVDDQTTAEWDNVTQSLAAGNHQVVARIFRLGPVGAGGQPAAGTYKFSVLASANVGGPTATASQASIVVEVVTG
jgi:hypothetical protein